LIFIPFHDHEKKRSVLAVILEEDNLARMKGADPVTLESSGRGGIMPYLPYPADTSLLIAFEADTGQILELARKQEIASIFKYLERGFQFIEGLDGAHRTVRVKTEN
jgi:hypothetical protein